MKQNKRNSLSPCVSHLTLTFSCFRNQLVRHSYCFDSTTPLFSDDKRFANQRRSSVINAQTEEHLLLFSKNSRYQPQASKTAKLKLSLNALNQKIRSAKRSLERLAEASDNQEGSQEMGTHLFDVMEGDVKQETSTNIQSSSNKLSFTPSRIRITWPPKVIKTYYLSNIQSALQGHNSKALEHLNLSLKVLHNQQKVQTPTFSQLDKLKVNFIKAKGDTYKKTLLIDVDQTLLRCQYDGEKPYDIIQPFKLENGSKALGYISIRPYAVSFLKKMSKHFEIIAFTATHESYADTLLDLLDPQKEFIKHRLYRKNCFQVYENIFAKDLRIVNRDLSSMILVDNSPFSYIYQLQNGIPILPYYGGQDNELIQLQKYLELVAKCEDVREFNKKTFKLHQYSVFNDVSCLVKSLYL